MRASASLSYQKMGPALSVGVVVVGVTVVGYLLGFIGVFVALPMAALVQVFAYRQLVPPPAPVGRNR